jgi:ethanolamine ammonia-lyase small subunit
MTAPTRWTDLRRYTSARVALGRAGNGLPTAAHLAFQADHAAARDAVHAALDVEALLADLGRPATVVRSAAPDRATYLLRPDLGRSLHPECQLEPQPGCIAVVIADGLSATAAQRHAAALVALLGHHGPIVIATQARVALGDAIGAALQAEAVLVLIGERPGLSSADSLGAYLTWQPKPGRTDAERNCVSNIRPDGLPLPEAAAKLRWLLAEMRRLRLSGVALKDEQPVYGKSIEVETT